MEGAEKTHRSIHWLSLHEDADSVTVDTVSRQWQAIQRVCSCHSSMPQQCAVDLHGGRAYDDERALSTGQECAGLQQYFQGDS